MNSPNKKRHNELNSNESSESCEIYNNPKKKNKNNKDDNSKNNNDDNEEGDERDEGDEDDEDDEDNEKSIFNLKYKHTCYNILCDHKKYFSTWYENNKVKISKINDLKDILELSNYYHCRMRRMYNGIDLKILSNISEDIIELDNMIGLNNIKEEIVNMIIYLLNFKNTGKKYNADMLHSVITGSPGCGKTTFIEIIAKIYTKLDILKYGHIVKTKRSELIGKYLGHTAVQTQKKIDEAKGGILLIDEAYSLGNPDGKDSFSKECIDTLNQSLSENKSDFICIIAGYKDSLDNSFFNYNEGLRRRFPFRFEINNYTANELALIFSKKIKEYNYWTIIYKQEELDKIIKDNFKYFINQGGDMETLFLNLKIVHNKRVFLLPINDKKILLIQDIKDAVLKFIKFKGDTPNKYETPPGMYI
jgi:hypothetical protein